MHFHGLCDTREALTNVAPQDAHRPSDEWLRTPRKRSRTTSQYSVTAVLFLRSDHLLATAGTPSSSGRHCCLTCSSSCCTKLPLRVLRCGLIALRSFSPSRPGRAALPIDPTC